MTHHSLRDHDIFFMTAYVELAVKARGRPYGRVWTCSLTQQFLLGGSSLYLLLGALFIQL